MTKRSMSISHSIDINKFVIRYLYVFFYEKSILIDFVWIGNLYSFSRTEHTSQLYLTIWTKNNFILFINLFFMLLKTFINFFCWSTSFSVLFFNLLFVFQANIRMSRLRSLFCRNFFLNWVFIW